MLEKVRKILVFALSLLLLFQQSSFAQLAGELNIASHLATLHSSFAQDKFRPLHLRYLSYDTQANNFKLLLDKGDAIKGLSPNGTDPKDISKGAVPLEEATKTLLNYFFIGLSLPNDSFWVNLRPDSPDNIIDDYLAQTDVGKIMLETDLQLKKDTAKATSPETPEGKLYWDKLYKKAEELFGSENISIPTLTRPWIVPGEIIIRETLDSAYIYKATLKVMLEEDYLKGDSPLRGQSPYAFSDPRLKALNEYSSQLIRELIIPKLTKEVNSSKRYANLRQVYYSLILAYWFKARFKGLSPSTKGTVPKLIDSKDLTNLTSKENWSKTTYFQAYQKSFKDGEYNIQQPTYTLYGQSIRSYFSGGMKLMPELKNLAQFGAENTGSSPILAVPASSSPLARTNEIAMTFQGPEPGAVGIQVVSPAIASSPMTEEAVRASLRKIKDNPEGFSGIDEIEYLSSRLVLSTDPSERNQIIGIFRSADPAKIMEVAALGHKNAVDALKILAQHGNTQAKTAVEAIQSGVAPKVVKIGGSYVTQSYKFTYQEPFSVSIAGQEFFFWKNQEGILYFRKRDKEFTGITQVRGLVPGKRYIFEIVSTRGVHHGIYPYTNFALENSVEVSVSDTGEIVITDHAYPRERGQDRRVKETEIRLTPVIPDEVMDEPTSPQEMVIPADGGGFHITSYYSRTSPKRTNKYATQKEALEAARLSLLGSDRNLGKYSSYEIIGEGEFKNLSRYEIEYLFLQGRAILIIGDENKLYAVKAPEAPNGPVILKTLQDWAEDKFNKEYPVDRRIIGGIDESYTFKIGRWGLGKFTRRWSGGPDWGKAVPSSNDYTPIYEENVTRLRFIYAGNLSEERGFTGPNIESAETITNAAIGSKRITRTHIYTLGPVVNVGQLIISIETHFYRLASQPQLQWEAFKKDVLTAKRSSPVGEKAPAIRNASSPVTHPILYPRQRSKMELGFKNFVDIPQLKKILLQYQDRIAQLTITIFPGVALTEDAKQEIIGFINGLNIPTTIVQLEAGAIGILSRTHFVNILAQTENLQEFQFLPLPYETPSINGRIIYSNFLSLAEISQDQQDILSAKAVLVPTNLNVLNYLTLGALAGAYPHIIDFLISVTKDYATIGNPKPPILEGLEHLKNMTVKTQETTEWAEAGEQEMSRRKLEELKAALDESIASLKKQSGSSPAPASSPAEGSRGRKQLVDLVITKEALEASERGIRALRIKKITPLGITITAFNRLKEITDRGERDKQEHTALLFGRDNRVEEIVPLDVLHANESEVVILASSRTRIIRDMHARGLDLLTIFHNHPIDQEFISGLEQNQIEPKKYYIYPSWRDMNTEIGTSHSLRDTLEPEFLVDFVSVIGARIAGEYVFAMFDIKKLIPEKELPNIMIGSKSIPDPRRFEELSILEKYDLVVEESKLGDLGSSPLIDKKEGAPGGIDPSTLLRVNSQTDKRGGIDGSTPSLDKLGTPLTIDSQTGKTGGIDFRTLPIVTQAIGNLSGILRDSPLGDESLLKVNLDGEWQQIERMASSGITPSSERIKEYIQTSCVQARITQDRDKILLCISDILRQEEESCHKTDPLLKDILVVLEAIGLARELKSVFVGVIS